MKNEDGYVELQERGVIASRVEGPEMICRRKLGVKGKGKFSGPAIAASTSSAARDLVTRDVVTGFLLVPTSKR
jgi:hypothetical protein